MTENEIREEVKSQLSRFLENLVLDDDRHHIVFDIIIAKSDGKGLVQTGCTVLSMNIKLRKEFLYE